MHLEDRWLATFSTQPDGDDPDAVVIEELPLEEAVAAARRFSDRVVAWIDREPYNVGPVAAARTNERWPTTDGDLRPRWWYEAATTDRPTHWWVGATFSRPLEPGFLTGWAAEHPAIVDAREITDGVELLVASEPDQPVTSILELLFDDAEEAHDHDELPSVPWAVRLRLARDRLLGRRRQSYAFTREGLGMTHRAPYPGEPPTDAPAG